METLTKHSGEAKAVFAPEELKVLQLISDGYTNVRVANFLQISVRTVESRRALMIHKSKTTNTATLIKFAVRNNLVI